MQTHTFPQQGGDVQHHTQLMLVFNNIREPMGPFRKTALGFHIWILFFHAALPVF